MKLPWKALLKAVGALTILLLIAGLLAPFLTADQYGKRLQSSLERALGRKVELGRVHFSLFKAAFAVDSVTIHEDPSIGIEPIAYIQPDQGGLEVVPSFWSLLGGRFVIASIRLDGASINLTKTTPADEAGSWNFSSVANISVMSRVPAIHVRNSRINFKFGNTKSVFYLTETDLDITPPRTRGGGWRVFCSAMPARTDRSAQGLGSFTLSGRWYVLPERVDLNLELNRAGLGDLTALMRGQAGGVHGTISSRLHLAGPISKIGIVGQLIVGDVHRWDVLPHQGQGWPIDIRGRLDLTSQTLELQSNSRDGITPPLSVRFRAADYLSKPRWAVELNGNHFPVEPLMELATHMGAHFPPKLKVTGSMDGAVGYSPEYGFQGKLAFRETALTIPDSPPIRFDQAYLIVDRGHVRLSPAVVRTAEQDEAQIEADYAIDESRLELAISTEAMKVASLRSQVALAAVPWLEQVTSGQWSGQLHYQRDREHAGWTGALELRDAEIPVPGLAHPLLIASAGARIDGARVTLQEIKGQAGKVPFSGEYRYEPEAARPHRLRLRIEEADAAQLETELMPTLRRSSSLIARALGRTSLPDWLKERDLEGSLQIDRLHLGGSLVENLRARIVWDIARVELDSLQARLDRAAISGRALINLRGAAPVYRLSGKVKGLNWQSGKLDGEATLETSGTGEQLITNLTSEGNFTASALDFGTAAPWRNVSGSYNLACSPRLHLTGLNLRMEDETYTGRGSAQEDGKLVILLTSGNKEMRMSGSLERLKVEEAVRP